MFDYQEIVEQVALELGLEGAAVKAGEWNQNVNAAWVRPDNIAREHPDNQKLLAALWSLIGDGYCYPRESDHQVAGSYSVKILRLSLTEKFERLSAGAEAHPAHPGFLNRFVRNTPTAVDEIVAYLEDAVSCVEADVFRPALAMVGVANEQTIRATYQALDFLTAIPAGAGGPANARNLLGAVHASIATWQPLGLTGSQIKEERHRLSLAVTFSEMLRVERNKVAHPGTSLADQVMVEQLIAGFAHHASAYWEIVVKYALSRGFVL